MPSGTKVGTAYVEVIPSFEGITSEIKSDITGQTSGLGESLADSIFGKMKGFAAKLGIGAAIAGTFKSAIDAGSELEQNIGGVKELWGESANTIIKDAQNAYKTAGLSANDYMQNVSSFSAALINSTGGDTQKAAKLADMAMQDMSDNVNIMGSNMQDVQNAYQGFSRGNYTMLDNLKLGFAGTKQGMQDLIKKAASLKDVQQKLGITVDANSMSYGNEVAAIHVVQASMGIMGDTAREASGTFQGSLTQMKAAFDNVLAYIADGSQQGIDIGPALQQLADSVSTFVFDNALPMIGRIVEQAPTALVDLVKDAIPAINAQLPKLISNAGQLIESVGKSIIDNLPQLIGSIADLLYNLVVNDGPKIITGAIQIAGDLMVELLKTIAEHVPGLSQAFNAIIPGVQSTVQKVKDFFSQIPQKIKEICDNIVKWWNNLSSNTSAIWNRICSTIGNWVNQAKNTVTSVWNGLVSNVRGFWNQIASFTSTIWNGISGAIKSITNNVSNTVSSIFNGMSSTVRGIWNGIKGAASTIWNGMSSTIGGIVRGVSSTVGNIWRAASATVSGIWNRISGTASSVWSGISSTIRNLASGAVSGVRGVWNGITGWISGVWNGIRNTASNVWNNIRSAIEGPIIAAKNTVSDMINRIRGFFNFHWSLPHLSLPHFSWSGKFSLNPPSVPHFSVEWHAKAMQTPYLFTDPTIFGMNGRMLGAGESGDELMYGHANLMRDIQAASAAGSIRINEELQAIAVKLDDVIEALKDTRIVINDREFGRAVRSVV